MINHVQTIAVIFLVLEILLEHLWIPIAITAANDLRARATGCLYSTNVSEFCDASANDIPNCDTHTVFLSCRNIQEYCTVSDVASANAAITSLATGSAATTAYAPDDDYTYSQIRVPSMLHGNAVNSVIEQYCN
jgi:hypothetical protein